MKDELGDKMKQYERAYDYKLPPNLPVILRLDGNSFSKMTKKLQFEKPFDVDFEYAMLQAAVAVLSYCSGSRLAYTQSDEITIVLRNDRTEQTDPFLANRIQKIASLCAAKASVAFNDAIRYSMGEETEAVFDCRVFVVPESQLISVLNWRQLDCFKNFVSAYCYWELQKAGIGRKTAQKMMHGLGCKQQQELIFQHLGVNVNDLPVYRKRGTVVRKETYEAPVRLPPGIAEQVNAPETVTRKRWVADRNAPRFDHYPDYVWDLYNYEEHVWDLYNYEEEDELSTQP